MSKSRKSHRRAAIAALLGVTAAGGVLASAASLNVSGSTLGAGTTLIASCDTDGVGVKFTTVYDDTVGVTAYRVSKVTVTGIDPACYGKSISVTLRNAAGVTQGAEATGVIDDVAALLTVAGSPLADQVAGAAVVIAD